MTFRKGVVMTYQEACNEMLRLEEEVRVLENRKKEAERELNQMKWQSEEYITQFYKEKGDVDRLEKMSLSKLLSKISGNYDIKYQMEYQQYITAKNKMDEAECEIEEQKKQIQRYGNEIMRKKDERRAIYQRIREEDPEGQAMAAEEEEKRKVLLREKKELEEASAAASEVFAIARRVKECFSNADSWATMDLVGGGLISDMAKYSALDEGASLVHTMNAVARRLTKELKDVNMTFDGTVDGISVELRAMDYIFDGIFVDWSVKSKIDGNLRQIEGYIAGLQRLQIRLTDQIREIEKKLRALDGE